MVVSVYEATVFHEPDKNGSVASNRFRLVQSQDIASKPFVAGNQENVLLQALGCKESVECGVCELRVNLDILDFTKILLNKVVDVVKSLSRSISESCVTRHDRVCLLADFCHD